MRKSLRTLVEEARAADRAYLEGSRPANTPKEREEELWQARRKARIALRNGVLDLTGSNIDELYELTRG